MKTALYATQLRRDPAASSAAGAKRVTGSGRDGRGLAAIFNMANSTGLDVAPHPHPLQSAVRGIESADHPEPEARTGVSGNLIFNGAFDVASGMNTRGYCFASMACDAPGWTATHGQYGTACGKDVNQGGIGQGVKGVQQGECYRLTFEVGQKSNAPGLAGSEGSVEVYWGGKRVAVVTPQAGQMAHYCFEVIGGAGDGANRLDLVACGTFARSGACVDKVALVQVAELPNDDGTQVLDESVSADLGPLYEGWIDPMGMPFETDRHDGVRSDLNGADRRQPGHQDGVCVEWGGRQDGCARGSDSIAMDGLTECEAARRTISDREED